MRMLGYSQEGYVTLSNKTKIKKDATEKLHSYRFILYNDDNTVCADSGEVAHLTFNDDKPYMAFDEFTFYQDLDLNKNYYIQYSVKTINGLEAKSPRYRLTQRRAVAPDIKAEFVATLDYENGRIKLSIDSEDHVISGTFLISRASSINGYVWEELQRFDVQSIVPSTWGAVDCTIEQGATYKYSLQQYNDNGIYSDRIISNSVFADFEDAFLYDGERQLRIRYNPKISSFKNTIQETKIDTIGSKHPFILRNGNIKYKDFPISGLISYHMDTTETFMKKEELGIQTDDNFDLNGQNITAERLFKLEALEWLNNGKAKVFRSPTEGNYIVRLMNVSLAPTDSLGRMLHTFSATAYEIADFNLKNLEQFELIDATENLSTQTRWKTVELRNVINNEMETIDGVEYLRVNDRITYSVVFSEVMPGTLIYIDGVSIMIGATGSYRLDSTTPIKDVYIEKNTSLQGLVTFSYKSKATNVFNLVQDVNITDVPCYQYIGGYPYLSMVGLPPNYINTSKHLYEMIEDCRTQVLNTSYIKFKARDVIDCYVCMSYEEWSGLGKPHLSMIFDEEGPKFYEDMDCLNQITKFDEAALYHIRFRRSDYRFYYNEMKHNMTDMDSDLFEGSLSNSSPSNNEQYLVDRTTQYFAPYSDYYCEHGFSINKIQPDLFDIIIDGEVVNIAETKEYVMKNLGDKKPVIQFCNGIIMEIGYMKQNKVYSLESTVQSVIDAKREYVNAVTAFLTTANKTNYTNVSTYISEFRGRQDAIKNRYAKYVEALSAALEDYREENGIT